MNPGVFTPRKPKEDASVNYLKVLSDLQSQSSLSDLSGYDNFLALINGLIFFLNNYYDNMSTAGFGIFNN